MRSAYCALPRWFNTLGLPAGATLDDPTISGWIVYPHCNNPVGRNKRSALRRMWLIRHDADLQAHMNNVRLNPVKHGLVRRVADWPHSTFHKMVEAAIYSLDWAGGMVETLGYDD